MSIDKVFFVKIRNQHDPNKDIYPSYSDYWRFVELSGFQICELEEVKPDSDNTYIFAPNIYVPDAVLEGTARTILYQLERPTDLNNVVGGRPFWDERYDEIWIYDRSLLLLNAPANAKYVVFGGHYRYFRYANVKKEYDFYHMSYLHGRRNAKLMQLQSSGYTMADAEYPHSYDTKNILAQKSCFGLCLHQDELPYIEPIRYTVFSCFKLPLFCEKSNDYYPYQVTSMDMEFISHDGKGVMQLLPNMLNMVKSNHEFAGDWSKYNYDLFTQKYTFRNCVIAALEDKEL